MMRATLHLQRCRRVYTQFVINNNGNDVIRSIPWHVYKVLLTLVDGSLNNLVTNNMNSKNGGSCDPSVYWAHVFERLWNFLFDNKFSLQK